MNLRFRPMTAADVPLGMHLKGQAGWNQTEADWHRFLHLQGDGCLVVERCGEAVATVAVFHFDAVAWIAMVLVEQSARHQGIGTALVEHAVHAARRRGARSVRLDATALGRPIYEKLGFVAEYELIRYQIDRLDMLPDDVGEAATATEFDAVADLDRRVTATNRRRLLAALHAERPELTRVVQGAGALRGYLMVRPGSRARQVGPAVAVDEAAGAALFAAGFAPCSGHPVFVDVPTANRAAVRWVATRGLAEQRRFTRMVLGDPLPDRPEQIWASSGPEKG